MPEWFQRTTWSESDRDDFFERLNRSRSSGTKATYLCEQAKWLQQRGDSASQKAALELLDLMITEHPAPLLLATALNQRAACLRALGDGSAALDAYRKALDAQRQHPLQGTYVYLSFGELALELGRSDLYAQALAVLAELEHLGAFPVLRYRAAAIRALISESSGDMAEAQVQARKALDEAAKMHAGMARHPSHGLVGATETETDTHRRLQMLAERT